jgi:hypothetical protein
MLHLSECLCRELGRNYPLSGFALLAYGLGLERGATDPSTLLWQGGCGRLVWFLVGSLAYRLRS